MILKRIQQVVPATDDSTRSSRLSLPFINRVDIPCACNHVNHLLETE